MKNVILTQKCLLKACLLVLFLTNSISAHARVITIEEATTICNNLLTNQITTETFDVEGVVNGTCSAHLDSLLLNLELWQDDKMLFAYRTAGFDSLSFPHRYLLQRGDTVVLRTRLEDFKGVPSAYCGYLLEVRKYVNPLNELIKANKDREWKLVVEAEKQQLQRSLLWITVSMFVIVLLTLLLWTMKMRKRSHLDALTHMLNRRYGQKYVSRQMRFKQKGFYCILDIDQFKNINDSYGHQQGDECLVLFSSLIRNHFDKHTAIRLDGDEFAVYCKGLDKAAMRQLVESFFDRLQEIKISANPDYRIAVSAGISYFDGTCTFEQLYNRADRCLYESKQHEGSWITFEHVNRHYT